MLGLVLFTPIDSFWAHLYSGKIAHPPGDTLILLTAAPDLQGEISYSTFWRATYAVRAWKRGTFRQVVVCSAGPATLNYLVASGIPEQDIVAETRSTTTRENALEAARLISGAAGQKVLLTSDFHMYRALRVFRKAGLEVAPMPAPDALKRGSSWRGRWSAFQDLAVETVKILYYRVRGWI